MRSLFPVILYIFLSVAFSGKAWNLKTKFPGAAEMFCTDPSGNCYIVRNNVLSKYDFNGVLLRTYSDKTSGTITSIDVKGGQRVLLFYQSSARLVFLDNSLSPIGAPVSLIDLGLPDPRLCCLSGNNGYWIYDAAKDIVAGIAWEGKRLNESPLLGDWRKEAQPVKMMERENQLLLLCKEGELLLLDQFGVPGTVLPRKGNKAAALQGEILYFLNETGDSLHWQNRKTLEEGDMILPADSCLDFHFDNHHLFLQEPLRISVYTKK